MLCAGGAARGAVRILSGQFMQTEGWGVIVGMVAAGVDGLALMDRGHCVSGKWLGGLMTFAIAFNLLNKQEARVLDLLTRGLSRYGRSCQMRSISKSTVRV